MNELLTLAIIPAAVWLLLVFLRVPGVILILSVLAGKLFAEELSQNLYDLVKRFTSISDIRQIQIFLLLLPVVLTVILLRSKTAKSKLLINSLPLLFGAISLVLFVLPYTNLLSRISEDGQTIITSYQSYIVSAAAGIALLFAWTPGLKREKHKK